jgi:Mor family transcriptional regulator
MIRLEDIEIDDLPSEQRDLAELVGIETYRRLVERYGGLRQIYIPKLTELGRRARNEEIVDKFNGCNFSELAREYDLSEVMVRQIVRPVTRAVRNRPMAGQMELFNF